MLAPGMPGAAKRAKSESSSWRDGRSLLDADGSADATALGIKIAGGRVRAEGDLDFRGTLGVAKDAPVGFRDIRLGFDLETDASPERIALLRRLTERYCVVLQTLHTPPEVVLRVRAG